MSGASSETSRFATPDVYTPKYLAERILTSKAALEGERKQVTVLFADLKSSLEMIADRDPEEARQLLDAVIEIFMAAIHRFEGTVNQVLGDGIMALFGAPLTHEDHAARACYAALRIQDAVRAFAGEVRRVRGITVQVRIGINSGAVIVRTIANDLRMDYSAVGQTTHLASRMEQIADPGRIVIAPDTARLVEGLFDLRSLGPTMIRGLAAPLEIYELGGARQSRSRLRYGLARGLSTLVGRRAELDLLARARERAASRHGQVVAIVGEAGVGKSRLVWESSHTSIPADWAVVETGAVSYGRTTPLLPMIDLLRATLHVDVGDSAEQARQKAEVRVRELDPGLEPELPALLAMLDLASADSWAANAAPAERRQRILHAFKRWLLRLSLNRPLLVAVEDLHWADSETLEMLDVLIESLPSARILLVISYRPGLEHRWNRKSYYHEIRLQPLSDQAAEALATDLLGDAPELEGLKVLLRQRTEGNPFFLEESVRTLVESGVLRGERGSRSIVRPTTVLEVPATVHAVLAARIDRLPSAEKGLLQCAAVVGREIPYQLLVAVSGLPEDSVRSGLAGLQAAEMLHENLFPDLEYTFAHSLIQEVAYGSLLRDHRHALHVSILDQLESVPAEPSAEQLERLAHHAMQGEVWDKAFRYLRAGGHRAFSRAAYQSAAALFERALQAVDHLPRSAERTRLGLDVRLELRAALVPLARFKEILDCLTETERLAIEAGDEHRLGLVHAFLTNYFQITGDLDRAMACGQRALALAGPPGDQEVVVLASNYLSATSFVRGDFPSAIEFGEKVVRLVTGPKASDRLGMTSLPAVYARLALVRAMSEVGEFSSALAHADEGLAMAIAVGDRVSASMAQLGLGYARLRRGAHADAIEPLEHALDLARSANPIWIQQIAATLAAAYVANSRSLDALRLVEDAAQQASVMERAGHQLGHGIRLESQGAALLGLGRMDAARDSARQALEVFRTMGARGYEAWTLRLMAAVDAAQGPVRLADARAAYARALALGETLGMRPLVARCQLEVGRLHRQADQRTEARAALTLAADAFWTLEMSDLHCQARADLATLD